MAMQKPSEPDPNLSESSITALTGQREWGIWTWPNLITLIRLGCLPIFLWLLLGRDDRAAAAWILLGLGATDWVDGWVARRFNQVSEFGKMFDPTADRLLFIVGLVAIMIDGSAPLWFCLLVIAREVLFGGTVAILTLFFKMERFDVTYLGKWATFLLMGVFPAFVMSASEIRFHEFFGVAAWIAGPIGLALSYYTAWLYVPTIRASLKNNR
jgi:cardiolipin synthase